ncbi:MAG: HEAT repeat domain-containing protein [Anaerolineae bacterium]|nr:hypothetical protein [Chloroflexota bacterium]
MAERMRTGNLQNALKRAFTGRRVRVALAIVLLVGVVAAAWAIRSAIAPSHRAGAPVSLEAYGYPAVELVLVYPVRVPYAGASAGGSLLTVYARAASADAVQPIELVFPLPDATLAIVDREGLPVAGRLSVLPGWPDALPYSLLLAHADTQMQPSLLSSRQVRVTPLLLGPSGSVALPELSFRTLVESRLGHALRSSVTWLAGWGLPVGTVVILVGALWRVWYNAGLRRRQAREQRLSALYTRLRDEVKVENWLAARQRAEELRLLAPAYRDLDRLDTLISTAETSTWRRDQLYGTGLEAYSQRDWPAAVQAFAAIEEETPYYRDVRFLRRTAALGADLASRDRSLRVAAATQLGEVADLLDMTPLLVALGDPSREVAEAAEASFARIGPSALDTLLQGLASDASAVRERSERLLKGMGQSVREDLLGALRSADPRITAPVARLVAALGARRELAQALLVTTPEHHPGLVEALLSEDMGAASALVDALLAAPEGQEGVILRALGSLKERVDVDRYLETRAREASRPEDKQRIQRALKGAAEPFSPVALTPQLLDVREGEPSQQAQPPGPMQSAPAAPPARPRRRLFGPWRHGDD